MSDWAKREAWLNQFTDDLFFVCAAQAFARGAPDAKWNLPVLFDTHCLNYHGVKASVNLIVIREIKWREEQRLNGLAEFQRVQSYLAMIIAKEMTWEEARAAEEMAHALDKATV